LELDFALKDHEKYHFGYIKESMYLNRYIGTVLRNKGLKRSGMISDEKRFWKFSWEFANTVKIPTKAEWKKLDRKYNKNKA
jgi:hypothetical protein